MIITKILKIWGYILKDMKEPLSYLPQAVFIGLAVFFIGFFFRAIAQCQGKRIPARFIITLSLFTIYLFVLLQEAFFSRPPGSRTSVDMTILGTWGHSVQGNAYVIENIIMFIPWGILLPMLIAPLRKRGWLCVITAFLASISLETLQYLTQRGHCQLDDIIMNTAGAILGWLIFRIIASFIFSKKRYH